MLQFANSFIKHFFIKGPKPEGLSIQRDDAGVPHIQAQSVNDLNWGIGYCHATDRSSQLLMMRILGQGRLCELLDDTDDNLAIDLFFRRINWSNNIEDQIDQLDGNARRWCQAYCDGVNAGLNARSLAIFKALGYTPEPWSIEDSILISRMAGYLTLAQSQGEIERVFLEMVQGGIDTDKLASLFPIDAKNFDRELYESITLNERLVPQDLLWGKSIPRVMASNNWVISGDKTASGAPMMANDPHLEVNRLPNVWYEMALSSKDHQSMGFGMPGLPGILVGRTPMVSWGATYTFMDTVDSWVEECRDGKYKRGKSWRKFDARKEIIKRKKNPDSTHTFYENKHGVLDGNPFTEGRYLTTMWSPSRGGAASINASYEMTQVSSVKTAMDALGKIESAFNWVIADKQGNIGYQMSGLLPKRNPKWSGFVPAPGWDASYDWQGFHSYQDLPSAYNPECGYIVTANQDLNEFSAKLDPINMPMGDYRAKRISQVLESANTHSVSEMGELQMDTFSLQVAPFLDILFPLLEKHDKICDRSELLKAWDQHYSVDSQQAPLFEIFYAELRKRVFGEGDFGQDVIHHLSSQTGVFIDFYQNFDRCLLDPKSPWYEHVSQEDAFLHAFQKAIDQFTGETWGDVNQFQFVNQMFQGKLPEVLGFDTAHYALPGGRATPHQGQIYQSAGRQTSFAPSIRLIADMSESILHTSIAGGPSDKRLSPWYKSGIEDWLSGRLKALKP